jgi:chemotaxis signal transduction protein
MSQAAVSDLAHNGGDTRNAFTFWVGDSLFAINLENVLSVEQDCNSIQPDPFEGRGGLGIVKHRGVPVRVFDFAEFLGLTSRAQRMEALIETLTLREQDYVEWVAALERAIRNDEPFTKPKDPHQCEFGKWYDSFETRDEELSKILEQFDQPHKHIHALADRLLAERDRGNSGQALETLATERGTTLAQLCRLFDRARSQVRDSIRSVLLFVTINGKDARVALRLNEISDMLAFTPEQLTATPALGVADSERLATVFAGYLSTGREQDCLLVDIDGLLDTIFTPA